MSKLIPTPARQRVTSEAQSTGFEKLKLTKRLILTTNIILGAAKNIQNLILTVERFLKSCFRKGQYGSVNLFGTAIFSEKFHVSFNALHRP